jgi:phage/conjugal plasmid C-4 type zinc finger TraR family protein
MEEINTQHSNMEEAEMGQLQALHLNMNAIAAHRAAMEKKAAQPSLAECEDCGDDIPEARQAAVVGCTTCIYCQTKREKK